MESGIRNNLLSPKEGRGREGRRGEMAGGEGGREGREEGR